MLGDYETSNTYLEKAYIFTEDERGSLVEGALKGSICANIVGQLDITDKTNNIKCEIMMDPDQRLNSVYAKFKDGLRKVGSWIWLASKKKDKRSERREKEEEGKKSPNGNGIVSSMNKLRTSHFIHIVNF